MNSALLGGLGLNIENLPKPVNKFEQGKLVLGVAGIKVVVGGYVDATFDLLLENMEAPKINGSAEIDVSGALKGTLAFDNPGNVLRGSASLAVNFKSFSGAVKVAYLSDGTVDISGSAAYNANKLSGEIQFVATDLDTANKFAKDALAAAGGKDNVQNAGPPSPVPVPKEGKKKRGLAATGRLSFNLTTWFSGTVHVVVDGKGEITVIGKIAPPGEIILFAERAWNKEIVKFEAKAYYGIPVVGNLNLFANISLIAIAKLGPAKLYAIEILGTYSTDPEIQKNIQISGSLNISAYGGLRLRAEGGAGIEILAHDLKFGIGLNADVGVKAYADARPTIGYRDPGVFYVSGTLDLVAQPILGLGGEFFIELDAPWFSPLSDDRWSWPLFSKEWPLGDPIGISATLKDYVLGSGKVPEAEVKAAKVFDSQKFMTNMVDDKLPKKSGGTGAGRGTFKEDGTVPKPDVRPKLSSTKSVAANTSKKGATPALGKSARLDTKAANDAKSTAILQKAAKPLTDLKGKAPLTRGSLDEGLAKIRKQVSGIDFGSRLNGAKWLISPKAGGMAGKGLEIGAKSEAGFKENRAVKLGDGSTHRLAFKGSAKSARLTLASVEKPIEDHLKDAIADTSLPKKTRDAARAALRFYEANIKDISGAPIPDNPTGKLRTEIDALPGNMTTLAGMLMAIAGEEEPPAAAVPAWGGPTSASYDFLSNRTSRKGQDARSGMPKGWPLIVTRGLTSRNGNWVRMHMISAGFGGLDIAGNLVPTPTAINTGGSVRGFEKQVEKILYGDVSAKDVRGAASLWKSLKARKGVVWVKTSTSGFWPAENDPLTAAPLYDASTFVKSVSLSAGMCFPVDGAWKKDPGVLASGGGGVSKPDFSGTYIPNINSIGGPTLAKLAGISEHFAREIARNGPFTSKTAFDAQMRQSRKGESVAITPELRAAIAAVIAAVDAKKLKWKD
jgi:hypothetical protein